MEGVEFFYGFLISANVPLDFGVMRQIRHVGVPIQCLVIGFYGIKMHLKYAIPGIQLRFNILLDKIVCSAMTLY